MTSKNPSWNGKEGSFGVYANKLAFYAEFVGCGDVLDENKMRKCPTKLEFESLDPSVTENKVKNDLSLCCFLYGYARVPNHRYIGTSLNNHSRPIPAPNKVTAW